jgi:hypothetical protein
MNSKRRVLLLVFCCALARIFAKDAGVLIDQTPGVEGDESAEFTYSGTVMPWFSSPLGEKMDLYVAAGFTLKYEDETISFVPELFRTQFDLRFSNTAAFRVGRIYHADPLGLTVEGLFDGLSLEIDAGESLLNVGAYYTGLLYKKNANIAITKVEVDEYNTRFDYRDFMGTYFAPKRLFASLGWTHPALVDLVRLNLELLGQFDLNGREGNYHSQYLIVKLGIPFGNRFILEAGGMAELIEATSEPVKLGLAGDLNLAFLLPTAIQDRLSLDGRWSSGVWEDSPLSSFTPLTTETQGHILRARFSGLSSITAAYTARLHNTFSLVVDASYFMRSDRGTYYAWPLSNASNSGYLLGGEAYAQLIWAPLSDVSFRLGGGAFFPGLGDTNPDTTPRWQVQLNIVLAVF